MSITRRFANLGNALDSASTSHFLSVLNKEGLFRSVLWTEIAERPNVLDSADVSSIIIADVDKAFVDSLGVDAATLGNHDSSYYLDYENLVNTPDGAGEPLAEGEIGITPTVGDISSIVDSNYVQARQAGAGFSLYEYTATDGQTTFADSDIKGAVLAYADGYVLVHYNGVLLSTTEYTATNGDDVILQEAADSGAVVMIAAFVPGQAAVVNPYAAPAPGSIAEGDSAGSYTAGGSGVWYGDRALVSGGYVKYSSVEMVNYIDEFSISTGSNAASWGQFGSLLGSSSNKLRSHTSFSDGSRGVWAAGNATWYSATLGTLSNYTGGMWYRNTNNSGVVSEEFGNLTPSRWSDPMSACDGTNGYILGGMNATTPRVGEIETIVVQTTGDATSFGELGMSNQNGEASGNNSTIVCPLSFAYGGIVGQTSKIKYFATGNQGNAIDFGNLSSAFGNVGAISDDDYVVMPTTSPAWRTSSDIIEYVTISTPGAASDFGDLRTARSDLYSRACTTGDGTYGVIGPRYDRTAITADEQGAYEQITIATPGNATLHGGLERLHSYKDHDMCSGS